MKAYIRVSKDYFNLYNEGQLMKITSTQFYHTFVFGTEIGSNWAEFDIDMTYFRVDEPDYGADADGLRAVPHYYLGELNFQVEFGGDIVTDKLRTENPEVYESIRKAAVLAMESEKGVAL